MRALTGAVKVERVTSLLVKRAEGLTPDLSSRVEVMDAATPLTHERYTLNSRGATSGWTFSPGGVPPALSGKLVAENVSRRL